MNVRCILNDIAAVLILIVLGGCSGEDLDRDGDTPDTHVDITVLDGYVADADVSDAGGAVALYRGNGVYRFSRMPSGNISVRNGMFETTFLMNRLDMISELNTGFISPVTAFLTAHPDLESTIISALGVEGSALIGDYIAANNLPVAKFAQIVYCMAVNGLETDFVSQFGTPPGLTEIFSTALAVNSMNHPARHDAIIDFLLAAESYSGAVSGMESALLSEKMLMQGDGGVPETGQIFSYDAAGTTVYDGSVRDDGYYRAGVPRAYTLAGAETVVDYSTGMRRMWTDMVTPPVTKPWVLQTYYDLADYGNTYGDTADTYCSDLVLDGFNDWRLPAAAELRVLVDYHLESPAMAGIFGDTEYGTNDEYWTSTSYENDAGKAWAFKFYRGTQTQSAKNLEGFVRCTRGASVEYGDLTRNDTFGFVADRTAKLMWQDHTLGTPMNWTDAISYCESSGTGGYDDWRLPNVNELLTLVDYESYDPAIDPVFHYTNSQFYWSSTSGPGTLKNEAWVVSFADGNAGHGAGLKSTTHFVRCVRGGL